MTGPDPYSFQALWRHYRTCRQSKRATTNALAFEIDAEAGLLALQAELRAHTYRPGPSICFITGGPKPREVFAAGFRTGSSTTSWSHTRRRCSNGSSSTTASPAGAARGRPRRATA